MPNFLNKIFNIYDNYNTCRTELTLFGVKLKFINSKLVRRPDYSLALEKVREKFQKKEKIRVAFYVSENSKWNAEELYNLLEKSDEFEPFILVSLLSYVHSGDDVTRNNLEENYNFFLNSGKEVYKAYDIDKKEYIDIAKFSPDIVFYQQPWGVPEVHEVESISKFALTCYFHYGIVLFDSAVDYKPFYKKLFLNFVSEQMLVDGFLKQGVDNAVVIGYPKLDVYRTMSLNTQSTKTIIYAPHFSYSPKSILRIGTFERTGIKMLEFAKKHSEFNWIFKPHPVLRNELMHDKKYGAKFIDYYYGEWAKIGKNYEEGNYFNLFNNTDLMITDCAAFLLEYMPTGKPIIRFENSKSEKLSDFGKQVVDATYRASNFNKFEVFFNSLFEKNEDSLKQRRKEITDFALSGGSSSQKIINELLNRIKSEV